MIRELAMPAEDAVHVLTFRLVEAPDDERLLTPAELARSIRYRFTRDRRRFVAGRAWLRRILSAYMRTCLKGIDFSSGPFGKPVMSGAPSFNMSHCGDVASVAVACFPIGIDIEELRPIREPLAERFFAPDEAATLRSLPEPHRTQAFFACWTRKEAFLKAQGLGLQTPLDSFSVSLRPLEQARVLRVDGDPAEPARWQLRHLDLAPAICGAVAARRRGWHVLDLSKTLQAPDGPSPRDTDMDQAGPAP